MKFIAKYIYIFTGLRELRYVKVMVRVTVDSVTVTRCRLLIPVKDTRGCIVNVMITAVTATLDSCAEVRAVTVVVCLYILNSLMSDNIYRLLNNHL